MGYVTWEAKESKECGCIQGACSLVAHAILGVRDKSLSTHFPPTSLGFLHIAMSLRVSCEQHEVISAQDNATTWGGSCSFRSSSNSAQYLHSRSMLVAICDTHHDDT